MVDVIGMGKGRGDHYFFGVLKTLNEAQVRWFVAREALVYGWGGIKAISKLTGISRPTILKGIRELKSGKFTQQWVRKPGGGRKRIEEKDPNWIQALKDIMEKNTAGDPMSMLRWTHKSTLAIARELVRLGHSVSSETVRRRLKEMDYSLQTNFKDKEGPSHAQRDSQFRYINSQVRNFFQNSDPVISVDCKKKEKVGNFKNPGRNWQKKGAPTKVDVHDFAREKAIPYGALDLEKNEGFVNVGVSHETAEFAVESIRRWWKIIGIKRYPHSRDLLICADCGGGNGYRNRGWKYFLNKFAEEFGLSITVCHYPPGTSKWNKIEHRMFSFISINWQGVPLSNYETIINSIGATKTKTGLKIKVKLDKNSYEKGKKFSEPQMRGIRIKQHETNSNWNYTILAPKIT